MKTFIHITVYLCLLLGFYGCNSDVFIDDFQPSASDVSLDGNGDSMTIQFQSGNWDWLDVYSVYSDGSYKVYDAEGNLVQNGQTTQLQGLGKIVCKAGMAAFTVERTQPKELKIMVEEHVGTAPFEFMIMASNNYETKTINVSISPSERYVIDHITYSLDAYYYDDQQLEQSKHLTVNNSGEFPVIYYLSPYKDTHRVVKFTSDNPEAFQILASDLTVEIPSMNGDNLVMSGEQAKYISDRQELPLPFPDNEQKKVTFPPYSHQRVTLWLGYEWFETNFILYATHPKTGKQRMITGTLQSKMPRKYYVTRENLNN